MKHDVSTSPRLQELKKNRRKHLQNKIIFWTIAVLILFVGFGFLLRIPKLNIENIVVIGNIVVDTEAIESVTRATTAGHYFWLIPKTNVFFYPKNKVREKLEGEFSRLKDISLNISGIQTLEISVAEREGIYTWCGEDLTEASDNKKCLFLDKDGYIFDEAPYFSGEVYFKFYGKFFEEYNPLFSQLLVFKDNLEKMGLKPVGLYVKDEVDGTMLLSSGNTTGINPEINFKINTDLGKLSENLQAALDTEPLRTDIKKRYSALEYIDLRFGNKVYYRFR